MWYVLVYEILELNFIFIEVNIGTALFKLMVVFHYNVVIGIVFLGRETPSVAGIINPGSEGFQKLFFGQEEIAIPVHST